jgi:hypothetical protein
MKLLKVFNKGLISPFQKMKFETGKEYVCHDFDSDPSKDCSRGFYATDWDGLSYAYRRGKEVYRCEVSGRQIEINPFKRRYEKITILEKLSPAEIKAGLIAASPKAGYDLYHVSFPVSPLSKKAKTPDREVFKKVLSWDSVRDSVRASVWASVGDSVWGSVRDSVWGSVGDSVGDSVWDSVRVSVGDSVEDSVWDSVRTSVWGSVGDSVRASVGGSVGAYISSLFPGIKKWNNMGNTDGKNPFQPGIDLWLSGYIPVFLGDGEIKLFGCKGGLRYGRALHDL